MFLDILTANQIYQTERYKDVWGAEGISGRVKFLPLAWAGMPKTSFSKNSDSPRPWKLRLDWDLKTTANIITIHKKLSGSLANIMLQTYDIYGLNGIKQLGLDHYGGSMNCRKKRGSVSAWSTHA